MTAALLRTAEMPKMPDGIQVLHSWGDTVVYIEDDDRYVSGNHMMVEGDESVVLSWFKSVPWVWLQNPETLPALQQFQQWHF